jgi:hypothetical protein
MLKLYKALVKDSASKYLEKWKFFETIEREIVHVYTSCIRHSDHCPKYCYFLQMATDSGQTCTIALCLTTQAMYV